MKKPNATREAMIIAGERRFAIHGLESASLRQIAIDCGQRNESVAQYHFGSREGLIRAILSARISSINDRRDKRLAEATLSCDGLITAETIATVIIQPLAEEIFIKWRSCYWIRFISQLFAISKFKFLAEEFEFHSPALTKAHDLIGTISGIDPIVLGARREILRRDVVWGLSRVEEMSFQESKAVCELHIANLIDMIAAGISAAPSNATLLQARALGEDGLGNTSRIIK